MNIVLYIDSMHRGGAERVMAILANAFAEDGHRIILVTDVQVKNNEDNYKISNKVSCVCLRPRAKNAILKNLQRIRQLRRIIKNEKTDVVLSFLGKQNYRMLIATFGLKCRKCVSVRNDPNREYGDSKRKKAIANKLFCFADICVFQTEDAKRYFGKTVQKKSAIIPNPIEKKFFEVKRSRSPKNIIAVGRLEPQKNHKLLIDAFRMIMNDIKDDNLLIFGSGSLGQSLQEYINNNGLCSRVLLMGEKDEIEKELAKAKIFVLSSDYEGMPNALMEAMSVGLPCIATDCPCGGPRQLFKKNPRHVLVPCNNAEKMSKAIVSFVNNFDNRENERDGMEEFRTERIVDKWALALGLEKNK